MIMLPVDGPGAKHKPQGTNEMADNTPLLPASDRAKKIVKDNIAVDSLTAPIWGVLWTKEEQLHWFSDRHLETGVDCLGFTACTGPSPMAQMLDTLRRFRKIMRERPEQYVIVRSARDVRYAHENGKQAIFFNSQSSEPVDYNLDNLALLRDLGIGTFMIVYNERFRAGDGCMIETINGTPAQPITPYGKKVIDACHHYGMIVDLSHSSEATALSAIEYNREKHPGKPLCCTHEGVKHFHDFGRNASDEFIRGIGESGGVFSLCYINGFFGEPPADGGLHPPSDLVDHMDHVKSLIGVDHIGLSTDAGIDTSLIQGFMRARPEAYDEWYRHVFLDSPCHYMDGELSQTLPAVIDEMLSRDYSEEDVIKIVGGNWMRIFEQVWG
jgi:membrane dipeptidase